MEIRRQRPASPVSPACRGLPIEIRRATAAVRDQSLHREVRRRAGWQVRFPGCRLGSFTGDLLLTVYEGTNLIRVEAVASTQSAVGGLQVRRRADRPRRCDAASRVSWRDMASQMQSYALRGRPTRTTWCCAQPIGSSSPKPTAAAIAAFPPPHTFFWAREVEINVGYNWYRKDDDSSFSFGIRQGEQEVVPQYRANWSLYSAPPGSEQHMAAYFYPTLGAGSGALRGGPRVHQR